MGFEDLSPEMQEKLKACETEEELRELAKAVGAEMSDEELEAIAGGFCKTDCLWLGALCTNDVDCMTNTGCSEFSGCPSFVCEELASQPGNTECTGLISCTELLRCKKLGFSVSK